MTEGKLWKKESILAWQHASKGQVWQKEQEAETANWKWGMR